MRRKLFAVVGAVVCACAMVVLSGCSSIETGTSLNGQKMTVPDAAPIGNVNAQIYGLYCFGKWGVWTGSAEEIGSSKWFDDTVTLDNGVKMLTKKTQQMGAAKTVDMHSHRTSNWVPFLLVFWMKQVEVSGNAVK